MRGGSYPDGFGSYSGSSRGAGSYSNASGRPGGGSYVGAPQGPLGINLLPDSWQFESAAWEGGSTNMDYTAGVADPFGDNHATLVTSANGTPNASMKNSPGVTVIGDDAVASFRVKFHNSSFGMRLVANAQVKGPTFTWSEGVPSAPDGTGFVSSVQDLGAGWFRAICVFDLVLLGMEGATDFVIRVLPWAASSNVGDGSFIAGVQLEPGTVPGPYLEKP